MSAADALEDAETGYSPHERFLILGTATLVTTLYAMTVTIANVALPRIQGALSATTDEIAPIITLNIVATAVATPVSGWLAARFSRRSDVACRDRLFHRRHPAVRAGHQSRPDPVAYFLQGAFMRHPWRPSANLFADQFSKIQTGPGDGGVRHRCGVGPGHRPGHRRVSDRDAQLALGVLYGRANRRAVVAAQFARLYRRPQRGAPRAVGLDRLSSACRSP